MNAMNIPMTQRLTDWMHERRIARHGGRLMHARTRAQRMFHWRCMVAGIHARSPHQVARMEAARGLGPLVKSPIKRTLIRAYCRGVLKGAAVRRVFEKLNLKG
jgi:hypothetical protein